MTKIKILNKQEIEIFDSPPVFNLEEKEQCFFLSDWVKSIIRDFRLASNKVAFVLQLGYFKASKQFYNYKLFYNQDILYVAKALNIKNIDFTRYSKGTSTNNKSLILSHFGYKSFNKDTYKLLLEETRAMSSNQQKPQTLLFYLIDFLERQKIEIPKYNTFSEIITIALNETEKHLFSLIDRNIDMESKELLNTLIETVSRH